MRPEPNPGLKIWIASKAIESLYTTSISISELYFGMEIQDEGKRKQWLRESISDIIQNGLQGRILAFDQDAALIYAEIAAKRRSQGRPISIPDAQIASIVRSYTMILVTRNISDFKDCKIEVINPFD
jgi:predicted nucleic acid-binding protein